MKRLLYIVILTFLTFTGCEDVYIADLDIKNQHIVVEARIDAKQSNNSVRIYKTVGFYDKEDFPPVIGATVNLIEDENNVLTFEDGFNGEYYINHPINEKSLYKLRISYEGETYESTYEPVPQLPHIDSVYGEVLTKKILEYDRNGFQILKSYDGFQFYADIKSDSSRYYRFYSRKIRLSTYPQEIIMNGLPIVITNYLWKSFYPDGGYNIAAPKEYSSVKDINKHPLDFVNAKFLNSIDNITSETERGWIYIIQQYSISVSAYQFYKELNKQLESEGKIFDPIYTQAFGNIKCISNSEKIILGNFEIQRYYEYRYFLKILNYQNEYRLEKINTFYDIPSQGLKSIYPPDWWMN